MTTRRNVRVEDYIFDTYGRITDIQRRFEKQLVSKAFLDLKWTKHLPMGCDTTKQGHREDISALDIDDGEEMLIFGSHSGSISVKKYKHLSRRKWRKPMSLNLQAKALKTLKWCPLDLRLFMVTTAAGWMRVCDTTMGRDIHGKKFEGEVDFDWNEYNTTNSRVAVSDGSASMKLIDFRIGMDLPQTIRWDDKQIDAVQWYPSKQHYLYAGRRDGVVGVFDIRTTRSALIQKKLHQVPIYGLRLSEDGLRVVSMDKNSCIHVTDTWDLSTRGFFDSGEGSARLVHRRPDLKVVNTPDLYVATNHHNLRVFRFFDHTRNPDHRDLEASALWEKPFVFRKSSYELIVGHGYNYMNVISLGRIASEEEEEE